jgi:hypothetical protein
LSNTEKTQEVAASKAGLDVKTARKYLPARRLPSEMKTERHWRTRKDWFEDVWPTRLVPGRIHAKYLTEGVNIGCARGLIDSHDAHLQLAGFCLDHFEYSFRWQDVHV